MLHNFLSTTQWNCLGKRKLAWTVKAYSFCFKLLVVFCFSRFKLCELQLLFENVCFHHTWLLKRKNKRLFWGGKSYHLTSAWINITDRIIMWTAAVVVITAGSRLIRTTSPAKTVVAILINAAASSARGAAIVLIANGWWCYRTRRRWTGIRRICPILKRVRGLHCNSTLSTSAIS